MIKVGVLGASGYAGADLVRLLSQREDVELVFVHSNRNGGTPFSKLYPNMKELVELDFADMDVADSSYFDQIEVLFVALPHGAAQTAVQTGRAKGLKVIDLSADFRLQDIVSYEKWYATKHIAADLVEEAVYGLPEVNREAIKQADLVANPGCYPTSILLGLYPLMQAGYGVNGLIISDAKSSISGAGRSLKDGNLYSQAAENVNPYAVGSHRHTPEIVEQLEAMGGKDTKLLFVPHLVPMQRGLLSTVYVPNEHGLNETDVQNLFEQVYANEPFVRVLAAGETPHTKSISGSNYCDLAIKVDEASNTIVIMSAIDNLIKGASGQALQNMNLMLGLDETKGLTQAPMWP